MAIRAARAALARIFFQRCFYLFVALLLLVTVAPLIEPTPNSRLLLNLANLFVIIAAVSTLGRSMRSFIFALLLVVPALVLQWHALASERTDMLMWSWVFATGLYLATLTVLLRYVFQRGVMTADRLWGAAAAYLMLGVLWAYLYSLIEYFYPLSFGVGGVATNADFPQLLYFSFTVLTSTGFGDLAPLSGLARSACIQEQIVGALFVSILIARLAGVYPPQRRDERVH